MDRHGSIERAEKLIIKNWNSILPVLILVMVVHLADIWVEMNVLVEFGFLNSIVFDFITFPIFYIGVTNFVVKLINDEKASFYNMFELLIKKPAQSYILSCCYVAITSAMTFLVNYINFGDTNLWNWIAIIINCFLTVKFVLAIYIFSQNHENTAISSLESAWIRSKGYGLELMKIYFTVIMAGILFTLGGGIIASVISALFDMIGIHLRTGLVEVVGAIMMAIVLLFENAAFSYLAVDIFSGSIEAQRFFNFSDRKTRDKWIVDICIILSIGVVASSVTIWSPSYVKYVKLDKSENPSMYESLFDSGEYEYKAPKEAKSINLAILVLNEDGAWETVESMEQPISKEQRKGTLNVTFNYEDGFYEFNLDTDGENYNKKGSDERLKFDFINHKGSSSAKKRDVKIDEFVVLGKTYRDENKEIRGDKLEDLMELEEVICTVVSFES